MVQRLKVTVHTILAMQGFFTASVILALRSTQRKLREGSFFAQYCFAVGFFGHFMPPE
jgi:hypothetical protein